jgi:hypothetical protein
MAADAVNLAIREFFIWWYSQEIGKLFCSRGNSANPLHPTRSDSDISGQCE